MARAYNQLRAALLNAPILVKVNWLFALFLSVDASMRGEGWVLWQLITTSDGAKVAVAILYGSRKYNASEQNWETTRQEASAIRSALVDISGYVFGQHFYLFSDHLNLRFMHNSVNRAVLRMRDFLSQFNMTVIHCPGIWNNADSLSRIEMERLPTLEAQELNSCTEARMTGTLLNVSQGTDTSEDPYTKNVKELVPFSNSSPEARILCTKANNSCLNCCLCQFVNNPHMDFPEEEDTLEIESAQCLNTSTVPQQPEKQYGTEYDTILSQLTNSFAASYGSSIPWQTLKHEAMTWNEQLPTKQMANAASTQPELPYDPNDLEDADWCGNTDRTNVKTLLTAAHLHKSSRQRIKYNESAQKKGKIATVSPEEQFVTQDKNEPIPTLSQTTPLLNSTEEQRLSMEETTPQLNRTEEQKISIEKMFTQTNGTQTTAADFRIATIHFPLMADFHSIHNNESGHHGLDYSWRKLLKHCGSKWANERGAATRIKNELKTFHEACPICQKVRGLKDKVKAKHSFIISRPFLETSYDFIIFKKVRQKWQSIHDRRHLQLP